MNIVGNNNMNIANLYNRNKKKLLVLFVFLCRSKNWLRKHGLGSLLLTNIKVELSGECTNTSTFIGLLVYLTVRLIGRMLTVVLLLQYFKSRNVSCGPLLCNN